MNEGCDWLVGYNAGHKVYCHYYSINDMVLHRYSNTANVLHMSKCGLCHPKVQETSMWVSHIPGLEVHSPHFSFVKFCCNK